MSTFEVPSGDKLHTIIGGLVMGGITVEACDPFDKEERTTKAIYQTESGEGVAACLCDIPLSNYLGASLSMIPAGQAKEYADSGSLPSNIRENLTEVLNVAANLFITPDSKRLTLKEVCAPGDSCNVEIGRLVEEPSSVSCFNINVNKYGSGRMSLLLT